MSRPTQPSMGMTQERAATPAPALPGHDGDLVLVGPFDAQQAVGGEQPAAAHHRVDRGLTGRRGHEDVSRGERIGRPRGAPRATGSGAAREPGAAGRGHGARVIPVDQLGMDG